MTGLCYISGGRLYNGDGQELVLRGINDSWHLCGLIAARGGSYTPGTGSGCVAYTSAINTSNTSEVANFGYRMAMTMMQQGLNFIRIGAHSCEGIQALYCSWRANATQHDATMKAFAQGLEKAGIYFQFTLSGFSDQNAYPGDGQNRRLLTTMTGASDYVNTSNVGYSNDNILKTNSTSFENFASYAAHVCDLVGGFPHLVAIELCNEPDLHLYKNIFWVNQGSSWARGGDRETAFATWINTLASRVRALRSQSCLLTSGCTPYDGEPFWQGVQWWGDGNDWSDMEATVLNLSSGLDIVGFHAYHFSPEFCDSYNGSAATYSCGNYAGAVPQVWCGWSTWATNMVTAARNAGKPICCNEWGKYCNAFQEYVAAQDNAMINAGMSHACIVGANGRPSLRTDVTIPSGWQDLPGTVTGGGGSTGENQVNTYTVASGATDAVNAVAAIHSANQGHLFYANGRYHVLFYTGSETSGYMAQKSSADLTTWSSKTNLIQVAEADYFCCVPEGTKLHVIYNDNAASQAIKYRRYSIGTDGALTADFAAVDALAGGTSAWRVRSIALSSDGYVLYSYDRNDGTYVNAVKYTTSLAKKTASYPYQMSGSVMPSKVVALSSEKWYCVYTPNTGGGTCKGRLFTTSLGSEETASSTNISYGYRFSVTADSSDNVHLTFNSTSGGYNAMYVKRTYSSSSWGTEYNVPGATVDYLQIPYISTKTDTGDQYVFWLNSPSAGTVYYRGHSASGTWDTSSSTPVTGATLPAPDTSSCADSGAFNGKLAMLYLTGSAPYTVTLLTITPGSSGGGTTTPTVSSGTHYTSNCYFSAYLKAMV